MKKLTSWENTVEYSCSVQGNGDVLTLFIKQDAKDKLKWYVGVRGCVETSFLASSLTDAKKQAKKQAMQWFERSKY